MAANRKSTGLGKPETLSNNNWNRPGSALLLGLLFGQIERKRNCWTPQDL